MEAVKRLLSERVTLQPDITARLNHPILLLQYQVLQRVPLLPDQNILRLFLQTVGSSGAAQRERQVIVIAHYSRRWISHCLAQKLLSAAEICA